MDASADMLACLPAGIEPILRSIESLSLGRTWSAVLLPSHLINHPDPAARDAFVRAARRHTEPRGGVFFLQRQSPQWMQSVRNGPLPSSCGVTITACNVRRDAQSVSMTLTYGIGGSEWTHSFTAAVLSEEQIEAHLRDAGFAHVRWFGSRRLWAAAVTSNA